jgi:hypothetical protein
MGRASKHPAEVRERAVRLVCEQTESHGSQWAAIVAIAPITFRRRRPKRANPQTEFSFTATKSR